MATFREYLPYYKRNLKVAMPVMFTQLGAALVGLFDSIMVGHYSTADLAAVSFSNAIFFTVMVFAAMCMVDWKKCWPRMLLLNKLTTSTSK